MRERRALPLPSFTLLVSLHFFPSLLQRHSTPCTEAFFQEHVKAELKLEGVDAAAKRRTLEALARDAAAARGGAEAEAEATAAAAAANSSEDAGGVLGDENDIDVDTDALAAALAASGLAEGEAAARASSSSSANASIETSPLWQALDPTARAAFLRAVASGQVRPGTGSRDWRPWWEPPQPSLTTAIGGSSSGGGGEGEQDCTDVRPCLACVYIRERDSASLPRGVTPLPLPLPAPASLVAAPAPTSPPPSAPSSATYTLGLHLLELLFAYAHTVRLYGGGWGDDVEGAAGVLLALAPALTGSSSSSGLAGEASVPGVLTACIHRGVAPELSLSGGPLTPPELAAVPVTDAAALLAVTLPSSSRSGSSSSGLCRAHAITSVSENTNTNNDAAAVEAAAAAVYASCPFPAVVDAVLGARGIVTAGLAALLAGSEAEAAAALEAAAAPAPQPQQGLSMAQLKARRAAREGGGGAASFSPQKTQAPAPAMDRVSVVARRRLRETALALRKAEKKLVFLAAWAAAGGASGAVLARLGEEVETYLQERREMAVEGARRGGEGAKGLRFV